MNFKARGRLKGNPELDLKVRLEPLRFETAMTGSCECHVGAISAHIGDVRIRAAIPFMKPRHKLPLLATIGGFRIAFKPFDVRLGTKGVNFAGILGVDGIGGHADVRATCEMEGEVGGHLPVKSGRIHVDLDEGESE
jgi:hypothetical protein